MITIIAVGITLVLCTIAHEWDIRIYKRQIEELRKQRDVYMDKYFAEIEARIQEEAYQLSDTPDDYIMD